MVHGVVGGRAHGAGVGLVGCGRVGRGVWFGRNVSHVSQ
jgi:hypothetical protein